MGQRITELQHSSEHNFLADWLNPLATLESNNLLPNYYQLIDPALTSDQSPDFLPQLQAMGRAASLCLQRDPESRPQMSKVPISCTFKHVSMVKCFSFLQSLYELKFVFHWYRYSECSKEEICLFHWART